jgi:hypothetical protein
MQLRPLAPGIEVYGSAIELMLNGFRILPSVGNGYLVKFGLATIGASGKPRFDATRWHPQDAWLRMFEAIASEVGSTSLFEIGRQVGMANLMNVPTKDMISKMRSIEIGYHLAHRCNGKVMYDTATGAQIEGIGHYRCTPAHGENKIISVCSTPYPCEFDHGVIAAAATQMEPKAKTLHGLTGPCRKNGDENCTYITTW